MESWDRIGIALAPSLAWEGNYIAEPSVFEDTSGWRMWYRGGWTTPGVGHATADSPEGPWTKTGDPLLTGYFCPQVRKIDSTYHLFAVQSNWQSIDHYTSSDGLAWTLAQSGAVTTGTSGQWDHSALGNCYPWQDTDGNWYLYYEAGNWGTGPCWVIGVVTAPSVNGPWTKQGQVLGDANFFNAGGPCVSRLNGDLFMWFHGAYPSGLPTDICLAYGRTPLQWSAISRPSLYRLGVDEGQGMALGQVADPEVTTGGYVFYDTCADGQNNTSPGYIKAAKFSCPTGSYLGRFSYTAPVSGWSNPSRETWYVLKDGMVLLNYFVGGLSNASTATLTLPIPVAPGYTARSSCAMVIDNGVTGQDGGANASGTTLTFYRNSLWNGWSPGGQKVVQGQITYPI